VNLLEHAREVSRVGKARLVAGLLDAAAGEQQPVERVVHPHPEQELIGTELAVLAEEAAKIGGGELQGQGSFLDRGIAPEVVLEKLAAVELESTSEGRRFEANITPRHRLRPARGLDPASRRRLARCHPMRVMT